MNAPRVIYTDKWYSQTMEASFEYHILSNGHVFQGNSWQMAYFNGQMLSVAGNSVVSPWALHCLQVCKFAEALGIIGGNSVENVLRTVFNALIAGYSDAWQVVENGDDPRDWDWDDILRIRAAELESVGIDTGVAIRFIKEVLGVRSAQYEDDEE